MATDGEGWVECACGERHWGRYGAAGLLLADGQPPARLVLQHRALWSHQGGTWGLPGGARGSAESAWQAALREAGEEAGLDPQLVRPHAQLVLQHPDWSYSTVVALPRAEQVPVYASDAESIAVQWHPVEGLADLPLLPAFGAAWPQLQRLLASAATVVVDAANVVGARPDGWWRDRRGATARLIAGLTSLANTGIAADLLELPGARWWPRIQVVTEGAARGVGGTDAVQVLQAPGSGDDTVVDTVLAAQNTPAGVEPAITVVTADRPLRERVAAAGGRSIGPGSLWRAIDEVLHPGR
ncbi:MAG TPA: NUDIX hydrolase [Beutenbergiaceae bacterium]|nr:NUDIX hydrolase [Beutenbergiaceae bacterium]